MFEELGDQLPTCEEAALLLAEQVADDIVNGRIEPYDGALWIVPLHYYVGDSFPRVAAPVQLAWAIADHPELRTEGGRRIRKGERQIKEEAARFLAEQRKAPRP